MAYAKGVVFAFGDAGKAADAPRLPQCPKPVLAACHKLVGIRLVPYVPDDLVPRGIQHGMQGQGELDDPEARSQMAARHRDGRHDLLADLFRQLGQSLGVQPFEILGRCDAIQNSGHGFPSLSRTSAVLRISPRPIFILPSSVSEHSRPDEKAAGPTGPAANLPRSTETPKRPVPQSDRSGLLCSEGG